MDAAKKLEIESWEKDCEDYYRAAQAAVVESEPTQAAAIDTLRMVTDSQKLLDSERETAVKPLNDEVRRINNAYKPLTEALKDAARILKDKIGSYQAEKKRQADEAARAHQEAVRHAQEQAAATSRPVAVPPPPPSVANTQAGAIGKVTTRKVRKFRVTNFAALPDAYKVANETAIREAMRRGDAIPGVEYYEEETLVTR